MKGLIDIIIFGVVFTLILGFGTIFPYVELNTVFRAQTTIEYKYSSVSQALIVLLSETQQDSQTATIKPVIEIIGEYLSSDSKPDMSFINNDLNLLFKNKCYRFSVSSQTFGSGLCKEENVTITKNIVLPYNKQKLLGEIKLVGE